MVSVNFVYQNGETQVVETTTGSTVMTAAVDNCIPGIPAECGGGCACGTCLVYVDELWTDKVGEADVFEKSMIEIVEHSESRGHSRLSCQIDITEELNGLVVHVPEF